MLSKPKLLNYIQELQQLVADNSLQSIQNAIHCLEQIRSGLEFNKLNVYVLSTEIALAESFRQHFNSYPDLDSIYHFQVHELAKREVEKPKAISPAFLILQEQAEVAQYYTLSPASTLTIGRQPGCDFHIPDYYTRVSGQHLEVHFCPANDRTSTHQWRVRNSDRCRNGTYINGERLTETHILKSGDRLVLGDRHPSAQSPELLFEHSIAIESIRTESHFSLECFKGCIVFLIIDSKQELLEEEKAVLELASSSPLTNIFLVTFPEQTIEVISEPQQENAPVELEILCHQMASINPRQIAERKIQTTIFQTIAWISGVENVLLAHQEAIAQKIEGIEKQRSQGRVREKSEDRSALLKQIIEQRSSLIEIVDSALEQSKQDLLDDSLVSSILHRLSDVIDSMEAQIIKHDNKNFLKLTMKNYEYNVNDYLMQFCEEELLDWAEAEWEKICWQYGDGGVEGLIARSQTLLESISKTSGQYFAPSICQEIEMQSVFRVSLKKVLDRVEYQPVSIWSFSIKKIRSSVFQVMSILFLLSFLGLSRGSFIRSVNKQITSSNLLIFLALAVILWLLYKLYKSYQNDKKAEIRKVSDKIKLDLKSYYQKTVKSRFAEKLARILKVTFKEKMNRFERELRFYLEAAESQSERLPIDRCNPELYKEYKEQSKKLENKLKCLYTIRERVHRMLGK